MKLKISRKKILLLALITFSFHSFAQLPEIQTRTNMTYMMGGIGSDESRALRAEARKWSLNIEFSERQENKDVWISDVYLKIIDANKKVIFEELCNGPIFLAKIPPGTYDIIATYQGIDKKLQIKIVDKKTERISINWVINK